MKKDIEEFVAKCPVCQQVKLEHQRPYGFLQPSTHFIPINISYTAAKLAQVYIDKIVSLYGVPVSIVSDRCLVFTYRFLGSLQETLGTRIEMAPYEVLYTRKCRSLICWEEVGEKKLTGAEIIQITSGKVLPIKGVIWFGKKEKLAPRYVGSYPIVERVGVMAYELDLPVDMSHVHPVFHISMLRKYIPDPSHIIQPQAVEVNEELSYEEQPVEIVDTQLRKFHTKDISMVKVLWRNHLVEECTWETEADMRQRDKLLFYVVFIPFI
ncbi:uncharacterized protein LOC126656828 [Mercurialis annua]|uniref:uncharacterized protein LOC126656828 n=1 Tax=Mercurialis annua TaxID=3986 RepID=UPI00215FCD8A|nr:uncharacterized protein LOC126656828 [Mercurialis annua]